MPRFVHFTPRLASSYREPFSSRLFWEFCQRFGKAPFTLCCGDDDTSRFTRRGHRRKCSFQQLSNRAIDRPSFQLSVADYSRKRSIKHGIICVFYRCNNVSYLFLSRSLVYTCISSSIIHGATLSNVCCFTFAEAESFPFFLDSSCPLSFLRRSNNSFIHPQQRVRWSWNIKMYEQFSARTSAFSF